jgi:hypothetical protein
MHLKGKYMTHRFFRENAGSLAVILVSVVFVTSRVAMPVLFDGSYIDEYWHITSGISLFETGKYAYFYNDGGPYKRGLLMSLWVGFWMAFLGKSLLVAKLAPISIAIINYFLLLYLSIKLIDKKRFQILLLLLYTVSPWCIFNHFYIRMFVIYELFLLLLLVLGYRMYTAMWNANGKKLALYVSLVIVLNILNLFTSNDSGKYLLPVASAAMLASLFIYDFNVQMAKDRGLFSAIADNILLSTATYRSAVVLITSVVAFIALDAGDKIEFMMNAKLTYTSMPEYKYSWLFWDRNGVITAFFVLAVATFWRKDCGFERIIFLVAGTLFVMHFASSEDLQIIRGVMYFFPLYYLTAVIGASKVKYPSEWVWYVVISSIFLLATVTNVPRSYLWGPSIRAEINYIEYARLYDSVINHCRGSVIVEAAPSSPFIARFHGVNVDYALSAAGNADKDDLYTLDGLTGKFSTTWGALPVLTDMKDLQLLNKDVCLIVRSPSKNIFLPSTAKDMLHRAKKSWHFNNMNLYLLDHADLAGNQ